MQKRKCLTDTEYKRRELDSELSAASVTVLSTTRLSQRKREREGVQEPEVEMLRGHVQRGGRTVQLQTYRILKHQIQLQ